MGVLCARMKFFSYDDITLIPKYSELDSRSKADTSVEFLKKLGIPGCFDQGSKEWFKHLNDIGFSYKEGWYCKELGYFADGYDKINHIWYEFDTPSHRFPYIKNKDIIRQNNIINHFQSTGNPLKHFIRAFADNDGKVLYETYIHK